MATIPLHPALVHVPLALAVLVPFAAALTAWLITRRRAGSGAWATVVAVQAVLFASAVLALRSGRGEEERVEDRVRESAIGQHEEAAEAFLFSSGVVLLLGAAGLVGPTAARRWTMLATIAGTVAVAALAVRTGQAGGELVYVHGAAGPGVDVASAERDGTAEAREGSVVPRAKADASREMPGAPREGAADGDDDDRGRNRTDADDRERGRR